MPSGLSTPPFYLSRAREPSAFAQSVAGLLGNGAKAAENLHRLTDDTEQFLHLLWVPRSSNLRFQIDNVTFQASYEPANDGINLRLWSILGYLPYSVESHKRRHLLLSILHSSRKLRSARFGLNHEQQIIVTYTSVVRDIQPPSFIFVPLVRFLREARPFIQLIGECL